MWFPSCSIISLLAVHRLSDSDSAVLVQIWSTLRWPPAHSTWALVSIWLLHERERMLIVDIFPSCRTISLLVVQSLSDSAAFEFSIISACEADAYFSSTRQLLKGLSNVTFHCTVHKASKGDRRKCGVILYCEGLSSDTLRYQNFF